MVPRLQPGRLAQLITALYTAREQQVKGSLGPALLTAAETVGLKVLRSSDQVQQKDNEYNITAALLAPDLAGHRISKSWPSAGGMPAGNHAMVDFRTTTHRMALRPAALEAPQAAGPPISQTIRLFPVYLIIAGIEQGLQTHMRANMQILSQADFFWGLDRFWTWVGRQLGHYQTVPDVLLKPQNGLLLPWLREFHEQHMPDLAGQGYAGVQVNSCCVDLLNSGYPRHR